jgi:hypothetical protein
MEGAHEGRRGNERGALYEHDGLHETLEAWCANYGDYERGPLPLKQVVEILATDSSARAAAIAFLSRGGEGYTRDMEVARATREKLAWAIVEHLAR